MITKNKENDVLTLYAKQKYSIAEIMRLTDIRSTQTIYRILAKHGIKKQRREKQTRIISVCLDEKADKILKAISPRNVSDLICNLIKRSYHEIG